MVLRDITSSTSDTVHFLQKNGILQHDVSCPGPCIKGSWSFPCGQKMMLKKTNDNKDEVMWRCRKKHKVSTGQFTSVTKDVKLSIRHQSWLVDSKIPLPIVCELMYLWSQGFSIDEIIHELKISRKTAIEWTVFFRETFFTMILEHSEPIGGNGIEVEIDESKFGKRKYHRAIEWKGSGSLEVERNTTKKSFHDSCS